MAINGRFKVSMGDVFPHGAYVGVRGGAGA
jgi:hypothetical protein